VEGQKVGGAVVVVDVKRSPAHGGSIASVDAVFDVCPI